MSEQGKREREILEATFKGKSTKARCPLGQLAGCLGSFDFFNKNSKKREAPPLGKIKVRGAAQDAVVAFGKCHERPHHQKRELAKQGA